MRKSVFIIASYAPSLVNFRLNLILDLKKQDFNIVALAPPGFPEVEKALSEKGVIFKAVPLSRTKLNPINDLRALRAIRGEVVKFRPSWVITYTVKPVIYGNLACLGVRNTKTLSLITGLGYLAMPSEKRTDKIVKVTMHLLLRLSLFYLDIAAFQNSDDLDYMVSKKMLGKQTLTLVTAGSGVDINRFYHADQNTEIVNFLLIARLIKSKGLNEFFEAAHILKNKYGEKVQFTVVGMLEKERADSIDIKHLDKLHELGVINYLGEQVDVRDSIAKCNVFVLPSFYREGTPRTILEAMAMGRAIITTDNVGCRETTKHDFNGFLIPVKDSYSLIGAMEKYMKQPELILLHGLNSRKIAESKYDVELINKKLINEMIQLN